MGTYTPAFMSTPFNSYAYLKAKVDEARTDMNLNKQRIKRNTNSNLQNEKVIEIYSMKMNLKINIK